MEAGAEAPAAGPGYGWIVARFADRTPKSVPGDLFVDTSCIACDTCRRIAPSVFGGGEDDRSFVERQPDDPSDRLRALMALVSCPTSSIGTVRKGGVAAAAAALPEEVAPGVFGCGYAAEASYGAASWLLARPDGNVLIDSPRAARPLLARIRELGGVRWMFLTHRDDVADHARFRVAFDCERVLHARDVTGETATVERKLEGDAPVPLADDLLAIPVPGHTAGSAALLWKDTYLFTGDHLWGDSHGQLGASRSVCWWDWDAQVRSLERLLEFRFRWVFPGHGRPAGRGTAEEMRRDLRTLVRHLSET